MMTDDAVSIDSPCTPGAEGARGDVGASAGRGLRRLIVGCALAFGLAACSTPGEPANSGDPVSGTADVTVGNVGVEDGTEGGLDLDNGNVPGSENDQDLDPFDDENDLNTDQGDDE